MDLSAFSGDANVRYQYSKMENESSILIVNGLESGLWQLVIGPSSSPRDRIQQNIEKAQTEFKDDGDEEGRLNIPTLT